MDRVRRLPGIVALVTSAFTQTADLVQAEMRLARAEVGEKLSAALASIGVLLAGAIFLLAALFLALQGIVAFLIDRGVSPGWAFLLVTVATAALGIVLVVIARGRLSEIEIAPERTIGQFEADARMAKEKVS
jgi:hypothetical protein